ncbi:MAG: alanine racemase [Patescibacteria group bacterium]|nr:alanine racemase [Patescibacteria group bacterium]
MSNSQNWPTWVEISRSALKHNLKQYNNIKAKNSQIAPVLKSNAYGHGLIECANLLKNEPIWGFCTVNLSESLILRHFGFSGRLLVLSFVDEDLSLGIKKDITFSVYSQKFARKLNSLARKLNKKVKIHLKVETGTGRLGLWPEDFYNIVKKISKMKNLSIEGVFTHLADSENANWNFTNKQIKRFNQILEKLKKENINIPLKHMACSAAAIGHSKIHYNLIRLGLSLYGLYPSEAVKKRVKDKYNNFSLKPVLSWYTKIIQIKKLPAGHNIGYGCSYKTKTKKKIAVLPVGYWDGYDRHLSNKNFVLIKGQRCSVLGRICMNMHMVDITPIKNIRVGERVTLIGCDGSEKITVEEMAEKIGTINYEIPTRINPLIPRIICQ